MNEKKENRGGSRPGAGRPPVCEENKKRTRGVMLTDIEYARFKNLAHKRGITCGVLLLKWLEAAEKEEK